MSTCNCTDRTESETKINNKCNLRVKVCKCSGANVTGTSGRSGMSLHRMLTAPITRRKRTKRISSWWCIKDALAFRSSLHPLQISTIVISTLILSSYGPCVQSKYFEESSEEIYSQGGRHNGGNGNGSEVGISPLTVNLATKAIITVNATCGQKEPETYCKLVEHVYSRTRPSQCQVCDAHSSDKGKRHPIRYTMDGTNRWWQSPTLQNGLQNEWVTINIDLNQVYQVAYIIIKAAISPRPGNWLLERSLDGIHFLPWQYFAISDEDCWTRYGIRAKVGKPAFIDDEEVICTSYFSRITPFEGGEIHTSLVNGRPGADGPSEKLTKFTMARYVRIRLQKIRTLHGDLMNVGGPESRSMDKSVMRRYFYSIKDISIGGHCVCFGHANECVNDGATHTERCMCQHNTCGDRCDVCCPLYNQYEWGAGNSTDSAACEACQCHGHAESCVYDPEIHGKSLSINTYGTYDGGGVCLNCKAYTAGINCEKCQRGYFRPRGVSVDDPNPCVKCQCDSSGSLGDCIATEVEAIAENKSPGYCICKEGFTGQRCNECAVGYRGFPSCEKCPCNLAGIVNTECEGDCVCKENVEGNLCSACKTGFFNLMKNNPDGCTQCFCHGTTNKCISSSYAVSYVSDHDNWSVSDLHGTKVIGATQSGGGIYHVANEEFASFGEYYWAAPTSFTGKWIHSYGLNFTFHVSWVQARGDTSGRPIPQFDLIIQSSHSILAFSHNFYEGSNATINVALNELNCLILPDVDNNVIQKKPVNTQGTQCSRYDIMEGLSSIKRLLLRAKFHTDQIEGMLHYARMEKAVVGNTTIGGDKIATSVEVCDCPLGYAGTSCDECAYGYRKANTDSWLTECTKCDCNGHAPSCELDGTCHACQHNTSGDKCSTCAEGFYGDPSTELVTACKICECPLSIQSNNFSPKCSTSGKTYKCTACPKGYEGPFCERCANGFYGNPTQPGDYCKPCACSNDGDDAGSESNICDHLTGECLVCPRNTVGWNCDECMMGFFGNPLNGSCTPCDCDKLGAINGLCNSDSGQCTCKDNFMGRKCELCLDGHGNPKEGCPLCNCNPIGSITADCNQASGQCICKAGIGGRYCNKCVDLHFGFSISGCSACDCHPNGSDSSLCDLSNGQCHCMPNVKGRNCDSCATGFWNLASKIGCERCSCDPIGSIGNSCDVITGQCRCKSGIGGLSCDRCLDKHYGFSATGCKGCDPCDKPGHICETGSGRCVCPPNTEGITCNKCTVGFWGFSIAGCQACNCSQPGSTTPQCSPETGKCQCMAGYEGNKCNVCKFGYYNYPTCTPCGCDPAGTIAKYCDSKGVCSCTDSGQCQCKKNVAGQKCDRCKDGTYGLEPENADGCMDCFCFRRTNRCSQGYFKWQRLAYLNSQNLMVKRSPGSPPLLPFNPYIHIEGQERCFNLNLGSDRGVVPTRTSETQLSNINNLIVIPDQARDVLIEKDISFSAPLYWQLPHIFLGDKVLSYNGNLRFRTLSIGGGPSTFPPKVLYSYPLVQIQGNRRLILEHFPDHLNPTGYHEVRLHEDAWKLKHGPFNGLVTKEVMMIALQNLQHILIRGTHTPEVINATLFNVSLDIAIPSPNGDKSMAHGIEVCDCPPEYNSTSCQNPKIGYYRWYKREYITSTVIIDLVGQARPCDCNGRSDVCDTESGFCRNCTDSTAGPKCDLCAMGHYGNPLDKCLSCPCPNVYQNHADSCYKHPVTNQFQCYCSKGYTGKSCERCDYGFFGTPWETGGYCQPCKCNAYGSVSDECDEITGQCNCRPGVTGKDCSKCSDRHVIIGKMCTSCNDQCTGVLFKDVDNITHALNSVSMNPAEAVVWRQLLNLDAESNEISLKKASLLAVRVFAQDLPTFENLGRLLEGRAIEMSQASNEVLMQAKGSQMKSDELLNNVNLINNDVRGMLILLDDYIHENIIPDVNVGAGQAEAKQILDSLKETSLDFNVLKIEAEEEMEDAKDIQEIISEKVSSTSDEGMLQIKVKHIQSMLDDLNGKITSTEGTTREAKRLTESMVELLKSVRVNTETIFNMTLAIDRSRSMTPNTLSETSYALTETEQVLLMVEDILRDIRNQTKEVEIRDNQLYDFVPLYRATHAQPAFDHAEMLKQHSKYLESLFRSISLNGSRSIEAVTAYERMKSSFDTAYELAQNASLFSVECSSKIQMFLSEYSLDMMLENSKDLIENGLILSGKVENALRNELSSCKTSMDVLKWKIKVANETMRSIMARMEIFDEDLRLEELMERIDEIKDTVQETSMGVMTMETQIANELQARVNAIRDGSAFDAVDITVQVNSVQNRIHNLRPAMERMETKSESLNVAGDSVKDKMKYLKALIAQSRHKSNTVKVSVGPDETGTCFRLYKWPVIEDATSIRFNFAPTKTSDSLLFYWPSSLNDDYIAVEMVNRQIRASWDLGAGVRTLNHPLKLSRISKDSDDPDFWFLITLERVGSSVQLDVTRLDEDAATKPTEGVRALEYKNSDEETTLLNLSQNDLIHIGGMSKQMRPGLVSNGLSGCIHNLQVNQRTVGLWNFVGNEGCGPCVECLDFTADSPTTELEYYFDGRGYAVVNRIQSKAFNSRFFDVNMEFRTYSESGMLFLTVNDTIGQSISIELKEGRIIMKVRHRWDDQIDTIKIETENEKFNTGSWIEVRAIWVYQRGEQTAQVTVNKKNFKKVKTASAALSLELYNAAYQLGGVSPTFDPVKWQNWITIIPYVGCIKNILIDSSTYDPLSGQYHGVESPCSGKTLYLTSFEGDGYGEFLSKQIPKDFKFGFSFKTLSPTGLIMLAASNKLGTSDNQNYYAVYLENGQIRAQIGIHTGETIDLASNGTRYDDGVFHYFRFVKRSKRFFIYMDDDEVVDIRYQRKPPTVPAGRLFVGGVSTSIQEKYANTTLPVTRGFSGCVQNFYFGNELLNFNYPISHQNQNLGQCPRHNERDLSLVHNQYLLSYRPTNNFEPIVRQIDATCEQPEKSFVELEEPFKALQFGDRADSYVTVSLDGSRSLKHRFNLTFEFRTFYPNGLFFHGVRKRGNGGYCLMSYLKDGQIIVKLFGGRPQDLVSPVSNLNDGNWHRISIIKADDKMYLYVDSANASQTKVPKTKPIFRLHIGSVPDDAQDCLENAIQKPDYFKGCMKNFIINSQPYNFDISTATFHNVNPCFKNIQTGTFFRSGSYAIYSHNLILGNIMEMQLDFKSDSYNGVLLKFQPDNLERFPMFTIFLEDGKVIARETTGLNESYEAVAEFGNANNYICNGQWHTLRANYEKGSISLRLDSLSPVYALAEPVTAIRLGHPNGNTITGSLFIGGVDDGASLRTRRNQFHGCIRNISINRQRRDWTDMALLSNIYLNACPA